MFDGVILMINTIPDAEIKQKLLSLAKASMLPVVVFDCDDYPQFMDIAIDNKKAMAEIVRHVIKEHGAKDIGFISGPKNNPEAMERFAAYCEVLAEIKWKKASRCTYMCKRCDGTCRNKGTCRMRHKGA